MNVLDIPFQTHGVQYGVYIPQLFWERFQQDFRGCLGGIYAHSVRGLWRPLKSLHSNSSNHVFMQLLVEKTLFILIQPKGVQQG